MSDVLSGAVAWLEAGHRVALVTVSAVEGSTPRPLGPAMAVREDGRVTGSVSAGCVDGEAHALALDVLEHGAPVRRRYGGPTGDPSLPADLADLGPTIMCGGAMTVDVEPLGSDDLPRLQERLRADRARRPLLLVYGANDTAADLARMGAIAGRRVVVCDQRAVFATPDRFPDADEVVVDRPDRHYRALLDTGAVTASTAVVVLAHDARIEDPVLTAALDSPAGFVGALGSRRTHRERLTRLHAAGVAEHLTARLRGPVGLHLGGVTSAEIALSILAEIVATDHGATGLPLSTTDRAIHQPGRR